MCPNYTESPWLGSDQWTPSHSHCVRSRGWYQWWLLWSWLLTWGVLSFPPITYKTTTQTRTATATSCNLQLRDSCNSWGELATLWCKRRLGVGSKRQALTCLFLTLTTACYLVLTVKKNTVNLICEWEFPFCPGGIDIASFDIISLVMWGFVRHVVSCRSQSIRRLRCLGGRWFTKDRCQHCIVASVDNSSAHCSIAKWISPECCCAKMSKYWDRHKRARVEGKPHHTEPFTRQSTNQS